MAIDNQARQSRRPFFLRFPDDLREQLSREAKAAERSLAAEIVFRLRNSLRQTANEAAA